MASAAAAVMAKARRDVISHFMARNAVSADAAVGYEPERHIRRRQFDRLRSAGVIGEASAGRYWLDIPRYDEWQRGLRRRIGLFVGAAAIVATVAGVLAG